jgi:hypothetical protein
MSLVLNIPISDPKLAIVLSLSGPTEEMIRIATLSDKDVTIELQTIIEGTSFPRIILVNGYSLGLKSDSSRTLERFLISVPTPL